MAVNIQKLVRAIELCAEDATQEYTDYLFLFAPKIDVLELMKHPDAIALKAKVEVFDDLLKKLAVMEEKGWGG